MADDPQTGEEEGKGREDNNATVAPSAASVAPSAAAVPSGAAVAPSSASVAPSAPAVAPSSASVAPSAAAVAPSAAPVAPSAPAAAPSAAPVAVAPAPAPASGNNRLFQRRSPFSHNPPHPEERRARIANPRTARDYIINLREDLADFQEAHGLPRTRDYSFLSLGLSLAQETGRALYSIFLMVAELIPLIAIISLVLRFTLDKVIEVLETDGTVPRLKKAALFTLQIMLIMIPLWILVATIIIPTFCLIISIFMKLLRISGRKTKKTKATSRPQPAPKEKNKKCLSLDVHRSM